MPEPLQPEELFRVLAEHGVDYVLIGGLAASLHGSSALTNDADICPDPDPANLDRLAAALRDIDARVRTDAEPTGLPFAYDAAFLSRMRLVNLTTRFGDFDISFEPAGTAGYRDLVVRAVEFDVDGLTIPVAALSDIIRSKETADRPKDRATLPILYALRDEIAEREEQ
ncbi:MAG TPA: hypothetical protein VF152_09985 [Acidimicrobiia bacterium]